MFFLKLKKLCSGILAVALSVSVLLPASNQALAAGGAYETGVYRNLFVEGGKTQAQVDAKLKTAWDKLFYGNDSTERLYFPVGTDMAYIKDVANGDVRSEGMSYAMMISVQMDKQKEFDNLWRWSKKYMQHQSGALKGFFAWQCNFNGGIMDSTPASDGDEYFAMALLFAAKRWGNNSTGIDYNKEAQIILDAMLHQSDDGQGYNMFNKNSNQVVFCPTAGNYDFTDPSYHLPAFYELWALWDDSDNALWSKIASTSRDFFKKTTHSTTGLSPDYAEFSGAPKEVSWSSGHGDFRYDAWRTASNIAVDYAWFGKDSWATTFADRLQNFFYSQGIKTYSSNYTLSGSKLNNDHSPGLVAMNAVASLATNTSKSKEFVEEFWNTSVPSGQYRYYDGMLYFLGLLHVSGNFKMWGVKSEPQATIGDANDDGKVDALDFAAVKMYLLNSSTTINLKNADMNEDGAVDALDFAALKKVLLNN